MIEEKDIQISSKGLHDFIGVKVMVLESYLREVNCPLDSTKRPNIEL